jgi:hypothetical protein
MTMKKLFLGSLVAVALGSVTLPAAARTNVDLYVNVGPPPAPLYEVVPAPRYGFVWVPGYWDWRGHRHVWVAGHYVRSRPGYVYHTPRYYESGGRWYVAQGGWRARDADGDGVPNGYDRAPNNPYRY